MESKIKDQSRPSLREDIYFNKVEEYTHTINFRWRIPHYDRPLAISTAENDLKESLLSLSYGESKEMAYHFVDWENMSILSSPLEKQKILVINCSKFPSNGPKSISELVAKANKLGWKTFITFGWRTQKFYGGSLGPQSNDVRIDVYGISGHDFASGLDGAEIIIHGNAQDRVGQKMKSGRLAIYGDVGRDCLQKAEGGEAYVLGNVNGRPLTNSSGSPRLVINGTCFDHGEELSSTTNKLKNSGFVILNGLRFNEKGEIEDLETPYSEKCLLSLALESTVYIRDPQSKIKNGQLRRGRILELNENDCLNIFLCLKENEKLFNISILDLITAKNQLLPFHKVYFKVESIEPQI